MGTLLLIGLWAFLISAIGASLLLMMYIWEQVLHRILKHFRIYDKLLILYRNKEFLEKIKNEEGEFK